MLQLLTLLADSGGTLGVKHIADAMQLPPSTVHRLLQLLRQDGFVQSSSESRQYAVGPQFHGISGRVASMLKPADVAQPFLDRLASVFVEAVRFGVYLPEQGRMSFLARADGKQRLKYHIDMFVPASLIWGRPVRRS